MDKRELYFDQLRAIATILVIMIHVSSPLLYSFGDISLYHWNTANFYNSFSRFCVPIFFMLSGALLLKKEYLIDDFFKKRMLRILPALFFWSLVYIIYKIIFYEIGFNSALGVLRFFIKNLAQGSQFHLWFVYTILGLYLFVPIISKWVRNSSQKEILYFLIIWGISLFYNIPNSGEYLPSITLVNFSGYLGYMVLGYFLSKFQDVKKWKCILLFSIGFVFTYFGTYFLTTSNKSFNQLFYAYLRPNVLLCSVAVFLFVKSISLKSDFINKMFKTLSLNSYGIYLIHILILDLLFKLGLELDFIHPVFSIPLITLLILLISLLIIHLAKRVKYVSYLVS